MSQPVCCPRCGAQLFGGPRGLSALRFDEEFYRIEFGGRAAYLGWRRFGLMRLLHAVAPRPAYVDWLQEAGNFKRSNLHKAIKRLRCDVAPLGLEISTHYGAKFYVLHVAAAAPAAERRASPRAHISCA